MNNQKWQDWKITTNHSSKNVTANVLEQDVAFCLLHIDNGQRCTYKISVQRGKSLGIFVSPCLLQSTRVPRQEQLTGQEFGWVIEKVAHNNESHTIKKHQTQEFSLQNHVTFGQTAIF